MIDTLLKILRWYLPAPEIRLLDDGDICLNWYLLDYTKIATVSIDAAGGVNWSTLHHGHGTDVDELRKLLEAKEWT